ncbi:MAG: helix-turn-helix transcriptional regulator [Deltaproteobacteria bacterium]|nr:helix-turn-helix transcriptional regulator [Deltaproteobacteria bacterium]
MGWSKEDIRGFRGEFELTQQELGDLLGVTQNYIFMMEAGLRKPGKPLMLLLDCVKEKLIQKRKEVKKHGQRKKGEGQD